MSRRVILAVFCTFIALVAASTWVPVREEWLGLRRGSPHRYHRRYMWVWDLIHDPEDTWHARLPSFDSCLVCAKSKSFELDRVRLGLTIVVLLVTGTILVTCLRLADRHAHDSLGTGHDGSRA